MVESVLSCRTDWNAKKHGLLAQTNTFSYLEVYSEFEFQTRSVVKYPNMIPEWTTGAERDSNTISEEFQTPKNTDCSFRQPSEFPDQLSLDNSEQGFQTRPTTKYPAHDSVLETCRVERIQTRISAA